MTTGKKTTAESDSVRRFCPMCGTQTGQARCPLDGAITLAITSPRAHAERTAAPLQRDDLVDGRYRVIEPIGQGSFGVVFRAEHVRSGQSVALKVLRLDGRQGAATERFLKEGRALARLRHAATIRIFDVGTTAAGAPYMAMEFIDGPNLEQLLDSRKASAAALTEPQALDLIIPVLGSLVEAHGLGLVHRDLKPANILLTEVADEPLVVKVVDFGVVRTEDSDLTTRQSFIGTPRYMSPEQCRGDAVDARSDLYSLGCVLFEAVCGAPPFAGTNHVDTMILQLSAAIPDVRTCARSPVSEAFAAVVDRALAKAPDDRFASASSMRNALRIIREEGWSDVPVTAMHTMIGVGIGESWRGAIESVEAAAREVTQAGVRIGARGTAVSAVAGTDTNVNILPGRGRAAAGPAVDDIVGVVAEATAEAVVEAAPAGRLPFDPSPSQEVVALPSRRRVAAAIAAAQARADAEAKRRSESPTRMGCLPEVGAGQIPNRHAPVDRSKRKAHWARGTLVGTGVPRSEPPEDV